MEAPTSTDKNSLASWIIGILCGVVGVLTGYLWQTLNNRFDEKDVLIKEKTEIITRLENDKKQLTKDLRDCDNEALQILLNKYGITAGKKTLIITPDESEN